MKSLLSHERDQDRREALMGKLLEGLNSGKPIKFTDGYFKRKKAALTERVGRKKRR